MNGYKNKIVVSALALSTLFSLSVPVIEAEEEKNELIYNEIQSLKEAEYQNANQSFTMLDLRGQVTRSFKDDVEGDRKGGWSDQGQNDCRDFTQRGVVEFLGIPFEIIEPDENDGKSVIVLRGQNDQGIPYMVEVPVGQKAAGVYFLHTSAYAMGQGTKEAEYTYVYSDGTSATMEIYDQEQVRDFWGAADYETSQTAWQTTRAYDNRLVSMSVFALTNPYPDKEIEKIRLETVQEGGLAYIMIAAMTLTNEGPYMPDKQLGDKLNPSTVNWLRHENDDKVISGSPLDSSYLLDKPAGKYGRIMNKDGELVFENGNKAKLWGANLSLTNALCDKDKASSIADDLAMCGYNIVRFNDADIESISSEKLDALMYMISELKERGIYTYLCMNINADISDFVNADKIAKQKEAISRLMNTKNPYTGKTFAADEAIAMVELVSQASLTSYSAGYERNSLNESDAQQLKNDFNVWLKNKYKTNAELVKAWAGDGIGVNEGENLYNANVELPGWWKYSLYSEERKTDIQEFLIGKQISFYENMKSYLIQSGYPGMVTCSSNEPLYGTDADAYANSKSDFIARNVVWNEPFGSAYIDSHAWIRNDGSMLAREDLGIIGQVTRAAYKNTPMVVSEWSDPMCNVYSAESFIMMSVLGAKQDWTPIAYTYMYDEPTEITKLTDYYSIYKNPTFKALTTAAARLFHSTGEFKNENIYNINSSALLGEKLTIPKLDNVSGKTRITYTPDGDLSNGRAYYGKYSNAGLCVNYYDGYISAENEYALAFAGNTDKTVEFSIMEAEVDSEEAAITLTANDTEKLKDSDSLLLTIAGNSRNRGLKYTGENVVSTGFETIISDVKKCKIRLKLNDGYDVYALNPKGERKGKLSTYMTKDNELVFTVNDRRSSNDYKSLNFEIVRRK